MSDNNVPSGKIGINTKGIDKDIIMGKDIGQGFGRGPEGKQKALDAAAANEGSELVYEKNDSWYVSQIKEEVMMGKVSSLSKEDSSDITIYSENLTKLGIVASTISFTEDDFKSLSHAGDLDTQIKVAANPSTPAEIISELAGHKYYSIREAVGGNKSAPPDILLQLASDMDYRVRIAVAGNTSTPKDVLQALARDGLNETPPNQFLFKIQQAAAANSSTPAVVLRELFGKGTFNTELSRNSATPDDILKKLFK